MNFEIIDTKFGYLHESFHDGLTNTTYFTDSRNERGLVFYFDVVRINKIDTDYELWIKSNVGGTQTLYVNLYIGEAIFEKQKELLRPYFSSGINHKQRAKMQIPVLESGTWSYRVHGLTEDSQLITSAVKDIFLELDKIENFSGDIMTIAGIRFRPSENPKQKYVKKAYRYLAEVIKGLRGE